MVLLSNIVRAFLEVTTSWKFSSFSILKTIIITTNYCARLLEYRRSTWQSIFLYLFSHIWEFISAWYWHVSKERIPPMPSGIPNELYSSRPRVATKIRYIISYWRRHSISWCLPSCIALFNVLVYSYQCKLWIMFGPIGLTTH